MSYGFHLADINTFDDIIDWKEDHIKKIAVTVNTDKLPIDLRDMLRESLQDNHAVHFKKSIREKNSGNQVRIMTQIQ